MWLLGILGVIFLAFIVYMAFALYVMFMLFVGAVGVVFLLIMVLFPNIGFFHAVLATLAVVMAGFGLFALNDKRKKENKGKNG